jgi:succinate dehydrogenase / fumarate reductase cytochrome b subunit
MNWFLKTVWSTSVGRKIVMALTGLFLCSFLLVHLIGNLQLLKDDQGQAFNLYAVFMTTNPLIKTTSYLLYASILGHAFYGLYLVAKNRAARGQNYAVSNNQSTWASRSMGILGTVVLAFIIGHMSDFWWEYKFEEDFPITRYTMQFNQMTQTLEPSVTDVSQDTMFRKLYTDYVEVSGNKVLKLNEIDFITKDLYKETKEAFEEPLLVGLYLLAMLAISFHLQHGFKSAFQTLGVNHPKYEGTLNVFTFIFAVLVPLGFAYIPVSIFLESLNLL